jgi:two-component sensor histidine kinase
MLTKSYNLDSQKVGRIVLIISELLENVVKYTENKACYLVITLQQSDLEQVCIISLENDRTGLSEDDYLELLETVAKINSYEDYEQMYLDFARRNLTNPDGKSKLGMAMIRKLADGYPIQISRGEQYNPGINIRIKIDV